MIARSMPVLADLAWIRVQLQSLGLLRCPRCDRRAQLSSNFDQPKRKYPSVLLICCLNCNNVWPISLQPISATLDLPVLDATDCLTRLVRGESYGSMQSVTDFFKMRSGVTKERYSQLVLLYNKALDYLTKEKQRPQLKVELLPSYVSLVLLLTSAF